MPAAALRLESDLHWLLEQTEDQTDDQQGPRQDTHEAIPETEPNVRPVEPHEISGDVLAWLTSNWPTSAFTVSAALKLGGGIDRQLLTATLAHLCEQGLVERRGKGVYRACSAARSTP